jgi:hypothetical protein
MTLTELVTKINSLDCETLTKEMSNEELEETVEKLIYGVQPEQELNVVIQPYSCLPCALKVFTINGQDADTDDFGEGRSSGDCMNSGCHHEFKANSNPDKAVLRKYGITPRQFEDIGAKLEDALYVSHCGLCS